jgi:hypothetical protein
VFAAILLPLLVRHVRVEPLNPGQPFRRRHSFQSAHELGAQIGLRLGQLGYLGCMALQ